jgi:hypothetical protein
LALRDNQSLSFSVEANHAELIRMIQQQQQGFVSRVRDVDDDENTNPPAKRSKAKKKAPTKHHEKEAAAPAKKNDVAVAVGVAVRDDVPVSVPVVAVKVEPAEEFVFDERRARKFRAQVSRSANGTVYSV